MRDPLKGHAALRKGRWSTRDTIYFITVCLKKGETGLDEPRLYSASIEILKNLECNSCKNIHGLVLMPDHVHVLLELGDQKGLNELLRLFKGRMTPHLRTKGLHWQQGFYDRRLRETDPIGTVLRYIQMNPYRKGLINTEESWPYWYCSPDARKWMTLEEEAGTPLPEWLGP